MISVLNIVYLLVMIIFASMAFIVAYHLVKYSYNKKASFIMLVVFLSVTGILMFSNAVIYMTLPLEKIIPKGL